MQNIGFIGKAAAGKAYAQGKARLVSMVMDLINGQLCVKFIFFLECSRLLPKKML